MALLKIARMGHPVLATPAEAVFDPKSPEIRRLVNDMVETMMDANGAGLAAPQVHVPLRVVIFQHHYPYQVWEDFDGPGIDTWRDPTHAARQVRALLYEPEKRAIIARAGADVVKHTYSKLRQWRHFEQLAS